MLFSHWFILCGSNPQGRQKTLRDGEVEVPSLPGCWEADPGMDDSQLSAKVVQEHLPNTLSLPGRNETFILAEV